MTIEEIGKESRNSQNSNPQPQRRSDQPAKRAISTKGRAEAARSKPQERSSADNPKVAEESKQDQTTILELPESLTVRELAALMQRSPIQVIKQLMNSGVMANINQQIDFATAAIVAEDMGFEVREQKPPESEEIEPPSLPKRRRVYSEEEQADLITCPPVVTVMGHVDHGKTSLLDVIRRTNVVATEAGGITQHIGAYQVEFQGKKITFLDTPGHEAFTAMRARGAQATDIAILVIAADDGVMPQTIEAIDHARAARVPIIVALNKIDKENANPERVKQQLADLGLTPEDWGGDTICVPVSAKAKIGIDNLLEMILLVAEMADLKANPKRPATGVVIEARMDRAKGPLVTLLVQDGTLYQGQNIVIDDIAGRVRAMFNDKGQPVKSAPPATPVAILGLPRVPAAGDTFQVVEDEKKARAIAAERAAAKEQTTQRATKALTLEEIYAQAQAGAVKELNLILKVDVQGSLEPIINSLQRLGDESLKVSVIHQGTGDITESDIMLAIASQAVVIGFNVSIAPAAQRMAEAEGVDVRVYNIIYKLVDEVERALKGLLEPVYEEVTVGRAVVRATFRIPDRGRVAGVQVIEGQALRNALVRVYRGEEVIFDGRVASLKRFKEDVREVNAGLECGVGIEGFDQFEEDDILEFYRQERVS